VTHAGSTADLVAWCSAFAGLAGTWLLAERCRWGWAVRLGADAGWLCFAVLTGYPALVAEAALFTVMDVRGFLRWRA
jgi:hypothetical protein